MNHYCLQFFGTAHGYDLDWEEHAAAANRLIDSARAVDGATVLFLNVINYVIVGGVCGRLWLAETTETVLGFAYFSTCE